MTKTTHELFHQDPIESSDASGSNLNPDYLTREIRDLAEAVRTHTETPEDLALLASDLDKLRDSEMMPVYQKLLAAAELAAATHDPDHIAYANSLLDEAFPVKYGSDGQVVPSEYAPNGHKLTEQGMEANMEARRAFSMAMTDTNPEHSFGEELAYWVQKIENESGKGTDEDLREHMQKYLEENHDLEKLQSKKAKDVKNLGKTAAEPTGQYGLYGGDTLFGYHPDDKPLERKAEEKSDK